MADVKREMELAERRKHDPQPDLAQDHLVRKIFSKFRKPSDTSSVPMFSRPSSSNPVTLPNTANSLGSNDPEKGFPPSGVGSLSEKTGGGTGSASTTGAIFGGSVGGIGSSIGGRELGSLHSEISNKTIGDNMPDSRGSSAASKASRWAAALANAATNNNNSINTALGALDKEYDDNNMGGRRTELVCKKSEHIHVVKDIRPPTQGNKWPRIPTSSGRPETIEEGREPETTGPLTGTTMAATGTGGGLGLLAAAVAASKSGIGAHDTLSEGGKGVGSGGGGGDTKIVLHPKSINNVDYQQIVASLIDMRVDLKLEIQKLSSRVNKIDDHLS